MPELKEVWDSGLGAMARAREILDAAYAENREMTDEENANYELAIADADKFKGVVDRELTMREREAAFGAISLPDAQPTRVEDARLQAGGDTQTPQIRGASPGADDTQSKRIRAFLMGAYHEGYGDSSTVPNAKMITLQMSEDFFGAPSWRSREDGGVMHANGSPRVRDLSVGTNTAGGFTVDDAIMRTLEVNRLRFNSVEPVATVINTMDGSGLAMPTANDVLNEGELLAEGGGASEQDPAFGSVNLPVYKFSSKTVQISLELLQDSVFNMEQTLGNLLGERLGRVEATFFTNGTGTNQPQGIVTAASTGKTVTTSNKLAYDDVIDLWTSVDPAYADMGSWMYNRKMTGRLMKLRDENGLPIWHRNPQMGAPDMLHGHPCFENDKMSDLNGSAGTKALLFGAMNKFFVRRAMEVQLFRLDEKYIESGQIGVIAFCRSGSVMLDAGTDPVKALVDKA